MNPSDPIPEEVSAGTDASTAFFAISRSAATGRPNEDRYVIHPLQDGSTLLAVADGLGGNVAGGHSAQIAQEKLKSVTGIENGLELVELDRIAGEIDRSICRIATTDPALENTGSTLLAVLLRGQMAFWVHVGDSRLYLLRHGTLTRITEDQTLARFLVKEGEITDDQALTHYSRQVMDQWLGCGDVVPETGRLKIAAQDLLILSSDGLYRYVNEDLLRAIAGKDISLETKARMLVRAAIERGGTDDITIVLANRN